MRFTRQVQTNRLKPVIDLTQNDFIIIEKGMGKSSRFLRGHDGPRESNDKAPMPDELKKDLEDIHNYIKDMKKRGRSPRKPVM
jgi:hypothetical protein